MPQQKPSPPRAVSRLPSMCALSSSQPANNLRSSEILRIVSLESNSSRILEHDNRIFEREKWPFAATFKPVGDEVETGYSEAISLSREIIVPTLSWLAASGGTWHGRASLNSRTESSFLIS